MPDYKDMYFKLSARVADAVDLLISAQTEGEEAYVNAEVIPMTLLKPEEDKND